MRSPTRPRRAAAHQAAVEQPLLEPLLVEAPAPHVAEDAHDVEQDEQVEDPDDQRKSRRRPRRRSRPSAGSTGCCAFTLAAPNARPRRARSTTRRVAEREEEARRRAGASPPAGTSASCCRSPRCGRRRTRGAARTCTRACRAPRAPGSTARRRAKRPQPSDVEERDAPPKPESRSHSAREKAGSSGHQLLTFGSAWTVIATPATTMTSAETAGSDAEQQAVEAAARERRASRGRRRGRCPVIVSASPSENATIRTRPNASRCSEIAASSTTSADGHGRSAARDADREQAAEARCAAPVRRGRGREWWCAWPWRCARACSQSRTARAARRAPMRDDRAAPAARLSHG